MTETNVANNDLWYPKELIIHNSVKDLPDTLYIIEQCSGHLAYDIKFIDSADKEEIKKVSEILRPLYPELESETADITEELDTTDAEELDTTSATENDDDEEENYDDEEANDEDEEEITEQEEGLTLQRINAGKKVMFVYKFEIDCVDKFNAEKSSFVCPTFDKIVYASNGCYYKCDWCFLKGTYGVQMPYLTVRVPYSAFTDRLDTILDSSKDDKFMFNAGELADALSLEHITKAARTLIPYFARKDNGYLFLLTKSDNIDIVLNDPQVQAIENKNKIKFAWSINNEEVSAKYELVAPAPSARLQAAKKAQDAGYKVRLRLDPIVPVKDWKEKYAATIKDIFVTFELKPERLTIGTLRFSGPLYNNRRHRIINQELISMMDNFEEMKYFELGGKKSFTEDERYEFFKFMINEIRKYDDNCKISMCKETPSLWGRFKAEANTTKEKKVYDINQMQCVCILDKANGKYKKGVIYDIPIKNLIPNPSQPREHFDQETLNELATSIKRDGVIEPLIININKKGEIIIVAGERRYRAAKKAKLKTVPCIYNDENPEKIAIIENLLREDMTAVETAFAINKLKASNKLKNIQVSKILGKSEQTISEILKICELPADILEDCKANNKVSARYLVALHGISDDDDKRRIYKRNKKEGFSSTKIRAIRSQQRHSENEIAISSAEAFRKRLINMIEGFNDENPPPPEYTSLINAIDDLITMLNRTVSNLENPDEEEAN